MRTQVCVCVYTCRCGWVGGIVCVCVCVCVYKCFKNNGRMFILLKVRKDVYVHECIIRVCVHARASLSLSLPLSLSLLRVEGVQGRADGNKNFVPCFCVCFFPLFSTQTAGTGDDLGCSSLAILLSTARASRQTSLFLLLLLIFFGSHLFSFHRTAR